MNQLVVLITICLTALTAVNGLRCFSCNSLSKPYCSDPYDPPDTGELAIEYQTDCDKVIDKVIRNETHQGYANHVDRNGTDYVAVCRKVVQKVEGTVRVFRSCGWYDAASEKPICQTRQGSIGVTHINCVCNDDLCNQGNMLQSTSIILPIIFILGFTKLIHLSI